MKVTVMPIIIGSLGTVPKSLVRGLKRLEIGGHVENIQIGQNTEKSPGDLRRLAVTQTPSKDHQLRLMWKNRKERLWFVSCQRAKKCET